MVTEINNKNFLQLFEQISTLLLTGSDPHKTVMKALSEIGKFTDLSSISINIRHSGTDSCFSWCGSGFSNAGSEMNGIPVDVSLLPEAVAVKLLSGESCAITPKELPGTLNSGVLINQEEITLFPVIRGHDLAGLILITEQEDIKKSGEELRNIRSVLNFTALFLLNELRKGGETGVKTEGKASESESGVHDDFMTVLFNESQLPLLLVSLPELKITKYNSSSAGISEYFRNKVKTALLIDLIDEESAHKVKRFLAEDDKTLLVLKNCLLPENEGRVFNAELELRKLRRGKEDFLIAAITPLTTEKILSAASAESDSRFASRRNVIPDLLLIMDKNGNYTDYFSPDEFPLIAAPEDFVGKNYREVIQEPLLSQLDSLIQDLTRTGTEKFFEYSLDISGKKFFFELRCVLMANGNILSLIRDITRIKEAESEKALLESRLRLILENFHGGLVIILNPALEIEFAIGKELNELGIMEKDLAGKTIDSFISGERLKVHQANFVKASGGENVSYIEDLGNRQYIFSIIPVRNTPGNAGYYVFLLQNVTELLEMQEKLKRSEGLYRLLAENSKDVISLHEIDGTYIFVSPSAEGVTGFRPEELTGKNIRDLILPENLRKAEAIFDNMHEMIRLPQFTIEYQIKVKSGAVKWIESVISFLKEEGNPPRYLAVSRNITERKYVEEKLRESESRYRYLVETMSEIIVRLDLKGNILFLNQAWRELTGHEVKTSEGRHFSEYTIHEDYGKIADFINKSRTEGADTQNFELRLKSKRKGLRYYHVLITLTRNEAERNTEILMTLTDITERKKTLEQLKQSQEQLSSFLNSMNDVVYSIDLAEKRFLLLNKAAETLYERPLEKLMMNPDFYRDAVFARDHKAMQESEEKLFAEGKMTSEYRIRTDEGNVKWIQDKVWLVKNEYGVPVRIEGIASDITERKRMEQGILRSLEKEKELNELKTNFIATASHEFRTPLATILTSLGLLEHYIKAEQPDKINSHLGKMKNSVNLIKQLLDDLIVINRNQSGYIKLKLEYFSVTDIIDDTISLITDDEDEKKLFITENHLSDSNIKSDMKLLQHILRNLIGNAYKYSGSRKPVLIRLTEDEDNWIFEISDKGIGIPEEDLPRIFDHFVRGRNVGAIPGTGLGLLIVKLSVSALKGEISLESRVGEGTKFTVNIPKVIFV